MNEDQIITELKKKNMDIFPELIDVYKNRIFAMAYKFTNDYNEAQDLSQDIFLKIYKEIGNFRFESKLSTWIYRVATNTCIDWKKKNTRMKVLNFTSMSKEEDNNSVVDSIADEGLLPDEELIGIEDQKEIHRVIYELPEIYKSVVILYHFNYMSYTEISKALNIPEKTVETRLYRARRKLKEELIFLKNGGACKWTVKKS